MRPSKSEIECASIANEYKRQTLEAYLRDKEAEFRKQRGDFSSTAKEVFSSGSFKRICLFVLFSPLFAFLQLVLLPFHYFEIFSERRRIRSGIRELNIVDFEAPEAKTISALWLVCGLREWFPKVSYDGKIDCIRRWLPALYGSSIARVIRIDLREEVVREQRREARLQNPPRAGVFVSEPDHAEILIHDLSLEMPRYD